MALNGDGIRLEIGVDLQESLRKNGELVRSGTSAGLTGFNSHFGLIDQRGNAHVAVASGARLADTCRKVRGGNPLSVAGRQDRQFFENCGRRCSIKCPRN